MTSAMIDTADFLRGRLALAYATIDELRAEAERLRDERDAARRLVVNVADRLTAAAECLGRVAERKDKRNQ
jgi:hypothetical protein